MKKIVYILIASLVVGATACSEEQIETYNKNNSKLYFNYGPYKLDSVAYSFYTQKADLMLDTVFIQINTMGHLASYDRPVKIVQLNVGETDAAVAGAHYVPFDDAELQKKILVKADSIAFRLPVVVKRDPSLETSNVRLKIGIEDNEHFTKGVDKYLTYVVHITSMVEKPSNWHTRWYPFFGKTWGPVKFRLIMDVTGITDWTMDMDMSLGNYLRNKCLQALIDYNKAHPDAPLREADTEEGPGTLVNFAIR